MDKTSIRNRMKTLRDLIDKKEASHKSSLIVNHLFSLKEYQDAGVVMSYVSFGSEAETRPIIEHALSQGKKVAVPYCISEGRRLLACVITSLDDLIPGTWGILEPSDPYKRVLDPKEIDVAVIPGLAFDRNLNRLGYGAGYYDRFLPSLNEDATKIGIAYDMQMTDALPADPHDIPMDYIITESGIIYLKINKEW